MYFSVKLTRQNDKFHISNLAKNRERPPIALPKSVYAIVCQIATYPPGLY